MIFRSQFCWEILRAFTTLKFVFHPVFDAIVIQQRIIIHDHLDAIGNWTEYCLQFWVDLVHVLPDRRNDGEIDFTDLTLKQKAFTGYKIIGWVETEHMGAQGVL